MLRDQRVDRDVEQYGHRVALSLVEPADQSSKERTKGERIEHGARVYPIDRSDGLGGRSAE